MSSIKRYGTTLIDYLTGLPTRKELILEEGEVREFLTSENDDLIKIALRARNFHFLTQIALSYVVFQEAADYFSTRDSSSLLRAGLGSLVKLYFTYLGKKDVRLIRFFNEVNKLTLRKEQNTEGEEWKKETDYPLSEEDI